MQGSVAHTLLKVEQLVWGHCTTLKDKSRSRVGGKLVKMYFISYSGSHESSAWRIKVEAECVNKRLTKRSVLFSKYLSPQMWFNTQNLSMNVMFSMTQTQIVLLTKILNILKKRFENPTFIGLTQVSRVNRIWGNHLNISNGVTVLVNISQTCTQELESPGISARY